MSLLNLKSNVTKNRKRVGRGNGSGHGTYSTRGQKGQGQRTGGTRRPGFEGGQTPLSRKMPKMRGFKSPNRVEYRAINVEELEKSFKEGEVDLTKFKRPVKLLGDGEVTKKFIVKVAKASASAIEKIKKAGGSCQQQRASLPKGEATSKEKPVPAAPVQTDK